MKSKILLEKAYLLLKRIEKDMKEHDNDPWNECPFCMNELFWDEDIELLEQIRQHLKKQPQNERRINDSKRIDR